MFGSIRTISLNKSLKQKCNSALLFLICLIVLRVFKMAEFSQKFWQLLFRKFLLVAVLATQSPDLSALVPLAGRTFCLATPSLGLSLYSAAQFGLGMVIIPFWLLAVPWLVETCLEFLSTPWSLPRLLDSIEWYSSSLMMFSVLLTASCSFSSNMVKLTCPDFCSNCAGWFAISLLESGAPRSSVSGSVSSSLPWMEF